MYNEQIEALISAALADGTLTEKEKQILFKKAQSMGIDLDEFEMVLDARLVEQQRKEKERVSQAAPKSNKLGDVRKCPACGTIIPPNTKVCSGCGMIFSNNDADILEIAKLQDNYIAICNVKPIFPTGPLFWSIYISIIVFNLLSWIYSLVCHPGWLGLAIPLTVISITVFIIIGTKKIKRPYTVFDNKYRSYVAEHEKLLSTAKSFYSQNNSVNTRIIEINNNVDDILSQNEKKNKIFLSISYGTLALTIILLLWLSFGWFRNTVNRHSYDRTMHLIVKAFNSNKPEKAEKYFHEFVDDWNYSSYRVKVELAAAMIDSYIALDNEDKVLYYANKNYDKLYIYVVEYYIDKEMYQKAIDYTANVPEYVYDALERSVKDLIRKNQKNEASQLIKSNAYLFNAEKKDSEYYKPKVIKKLTQYTVE